MTHSVNSDRSWREYVQSYLAHLEQLSEPGSRHVESARQILNRFTQYMDPEGSLKVGEIDEEVCRAFLSLRENDPGREGSVSKATLNRDIRYLNTVLAHAQRPTVDNPDGMGFAPWEWKAPRLSMVAPEAKKPNQSKPVSVSIVLDACNYATVPEIEGCSPSHWWQTLILTSVLTGIRCALLLKIPRPTDEDLDQNRMTLPKNISKKRCDEVYHLPEAVVKMIREIPGEPGKRLFVWPYGQRHFYRAMHEWQSEAQIPPSKRILPGSLAATDPKSLVGELDDIEEIGEPITPPLPEETVGPVNSRRAKPPITANAFERIVGAASTLPNTLDGIPENLWWTAFVLSMANSGLYAPELLKLPIDAYCREEGLLKVGDKKIPLHAHAVYALEALQQFEREFLFPWPKDGRSEPYHMLYEDYKKLLHRAGLPPTKKAMLRVRAIAWDAAQILDRINPHRKFQPVAGNPYRPSRAGKNRSKKKLREEKENLYLIRNDSPDSLKRYFAEIYEPLRLIGASKRTVEKYRSVINRFSDFLGCDATVHHLDEDVLDHFKGWCAKRMAAPSVNSNLRHLMALARHAWKKRKIAEIPRDVEFLPEFKTNPSAWSQEELARLLEAASTTEGAVYGISAKLFWVALILCLYDTGLRIGAALSLRTSDLDLKSGVVRATAQTQKQRSDQIFHLHPETLAAIKDLLPGNRELIFNWPGHLKVVLRKLNKILERAGLPTTHRDKFHRIRRTSATFLAIAVGEDEAVKHLDHSHPNVTRAYLDRTKLLKRITAADVMERPKLPSQDKPDPA